MILFLIENWQTILASISIPIAWIFGGKQKANVSLKKENADATLRIKVSAVNNFVGAETFATYTNATTTKSCILVRNPAFQIDNIYITNPTGSLLSDESVAATTETTVAMSTSTTMYYFVTIQQASVLDTTYLRSIKITN